MSKIIKKYLKTSLIILSFLIFNCQFLTATIRYVSKTGLSIPPYTSWLTAADSIQECINICVFGDTIYVANGVYEEQVVMIPGLSLLGAGLDSCTIDSRNLITSASSRAVEVADSCLLSGFHVMVYYNADLGRGIWADIGDGNNKVTYNRVTNGISGISAGYNTEVYKNIISGNRRGIYVINSNARVRKNNIFIDYIEGQGIHIEAFDFSYTPVIDSNYIVVVGVAYTAPEGIKQPYGARPIISNNVIFLKGPQNDGIFLGDADSGKVYNNLVLAAPGKFGIMNFAIPYLQIYNNYITGNSTDHYALVIGLENIVKNNVVTNTKRGLEVWPNENPVFQYNNVWNNNINYYGITPDSTNLSVDPMIVNDDSTQGKLDFHLQMYSPLIDAGDPTILDKDSTRSDIGLYGGPYGESYIYLDLPPRPPVNFTAQVDSIIITLSWNRNTEADFRHYNIYRDTTKNFQIDSTKLVASTEDTFYLHLIPTNVESLYFKLTAVDNQGNESNPSEEVEIIITAMNDYPMTINDYRLYQNYPNPFNPSTKIGYKLKEIGYVKLYVYDIKGELVSVLVNQTQEAGYYEVEFNASVGSRQSTIGNQLASGVYIYQVMVRNENDIPVFSDIKKMIYIK